MLRRLVAVVEAAEREVGGQIVVAVQDNARMHRLGQGPKPRGELLTAPGRLAQMIMLQPGTEEFREHG